MNKLQIKENKTYIDHEGNKCHVDRFIRRGRGITVIYTCEHHTGQQASLTDFTKMIKREHLRFSGIPQLPKLELLRIDKG